MGSNCSNDALFFVCVLFGMQVFEITPGLHMVEVWKAGGDVLKFYQVWLTALIPRHSAASHMRGHLPLRQLNEALW